MIKVKGSIVITIIIVINLLGSCAPVEQFFFNPNYVTANSEKVFFVHIGRDTDGSIQETLLCYMDLGQEEPEIFDIDIPIGKTVYRLATGNQGSLYALMRNAVEEDTSLFEIWEISNSGDVNRIIDISDIISKQEGNGISAFCMDKNGKFYIRELIADYTIVLSAEGKELWRIKDINSKMFFEGMGRAQDGSICCLFSQTEEERNQVILTYDIEEGNVDRFYEGNFFPLDDFYSVIGAGVEGEIRVKGVYSVYEYSFAEDKGKYLADLSHYMRDANSTSTCFLDNGGLFMVTKRMYIDNEVVTIDNVKFHYLLME